MEMEKQAYHIHIRVNVHIMIKWRFNGYHVFRETSVAKLEVSHVPLRYVTL